MGAAKEFWFRETERWIKSYPEWKRNLPRSRDLFNYEQFHQVDLIEQALRELGEEEHRLLDLLYKKQKSYVAVAMSLYMDEATVYRRKTKLLRKLAAQFGIH